MDQLKPGPYVALKSTKYKERPLIGRVVKMYEGITLGDGLLQWEVRGREGGKSVVYTDEVGSEDVGP